MLILDIKKRFRILPVVNDRAEDKWLLSRLELHFQQSGQTNDEGNFLRRYVQ